MSYNRQDALSYANKWALSRNPNYYDFSSLGGDCTNFCSQCLFAGAKVMNYTNTFGWYYVSASNRAPAWTGVQEFYNFLTANDDKGPYGKKAEFSEIEVGDFIQLGNAQNFYHTLFVCGFQENTPIVCSHSYDRLNAPLTDYYYERLRFIKILGVRN